LVSNGKHQVQFNIKSHDKIYRQYEERHGEIFNPVEQQRLNDHLSHAVDLIRTDTEQKRALDFGCGSGNLTNHLVQLGVYTIAADVSGKFLTLIRDRFGDTGMVETLKLNGTDLSNIPSDSIDMIAAFSVLHHVPDYLGILKEFIRVLKPGGVIYIDHEVNETFWEKPPVYREYLEKARQGTDMSPLPRTWRRFFKMSTYKRKFLNLRMKYLLARNPRYSAEGDIHVWPDDHIEWNKIEGVLQENRCEVVAREDYLLYRRGQSLSLYEEYRNKCSDIRMLVARTLLLQGEGGTAT
jgi:ubiquinone/menaquinone biosynthesis C-methylase UbiE